MAGMHDALDNLGSVARAALPQPAAGPVVAPWFDALDRDVQVARAALALVLGCPRIGSLLVDNLNASVHLRALLTDLFLLDQTLKSQG